MGCDLCFRNPGISDKSLSEAKEVILKMFDMGFRRIGFTGGEPTIREDYIEMIKFAKKLGFLTYLSTTGCKFIEHLNALDGILDWVGLPIDGVDYETNTVVRSKAMSSQHETIRGIFDYLSKNMTSIKIKLTTVVAKKNIDLLSSIVSFVKELPYDYNAWRFYQFCPLGVSQTKRENLEILTGEFLRKMGELKAKHEDERISWATFDERNKANVVMEPNFDVIIPDGERYTYLCNMKSSAQDTIISSINNKDILNRCALNRFWVC